LSSILKALKKLESDAPARADTRPGSLPSPGKISAKTAADGHPPFKKRLLIVITVVFLLTASGLFLLLGPGKKQPALINTAEKDTGFSAKPFVATKTSVATQHLPSPAEDTRKDLSSGLTDGKGTSAAIQKKKKETEPAANSETASPAKADVLEETLATKQPLKTNSSNGEPEPLSHRIEDGSSFASLAVETASESKLELQALAWSLRPEKRMAVINGHIVREGESIDEARVEHIGKNEVVFMKAGKAWRQLFRPATNF
jgi:hypothetical protein